MLRAPLPELRQLGALGGPAVEASRTHARRLPEALRLRPKDKLGWIWIWINGRLAGWLAGWMDGWLDG